VGSYGDVFSDQVSSFGYQLASECRADVGYPCSQNAHAVYIGLPHNHHYQACKAALLAGKHVLCEKPFTLDLAELDDLIANAAARKLFLMESVHPPASHISIHLVRSLSRK